MINDLSISPRCKLRVEEKSLGLHATSLQKAQMQERKNVFFRKVVSWQEVQEFYLPTVATLRNTVKENDLSFDRVELFLPSQINDSLHWDDHLCRLGEYEWMLRQAQARDSLSKMRDLLRLQDFLKKKKRTGLPVYTKIHALNYR
jgi:hypothetical protein